MTVPEDFSGTAITDMSGRLAGAGRSWPWPRADAPAERAARPGDPAR